MTFSTKLPALSGLPQKQSKNQAMPLNSQFSILSLFSLSTSEAPFPDD